MPRSETIAFTVMSILWAALMSWLVTRQTRKEAGADEGGRPIELCTAAGCCWSAGAMLGIASVEIAAGDTGGQEDTSQMVFTMTTAVLLVISMVVATTMFSGRRTTVGASNAVRVTVGLILIGTVGLLTSGTNQLANLAWAGYDAGGPTWPGPDRWSALETAWKILLTGGIIVAGYAVTVELGRERARGRQGERARNVKA